MRKFLFVIGAISLMISSACSSDDGGNQGGDSSVLLKKVKYMQDDPEGFNYEVTYVYNGTKLVEGNYDNGGKEKYYYTGDLITKIEYYEDGVLVEQSLFGYDSNGKLIEYRAQEFEFNGENISSFTYNSDGTITETTAVGVINGSAAIIGSNTLSFEDGELIKIVQDGYSTYVYTYDTKNSPFKNVTGYAAITYVETADHELYGRNKNILSIKDVTLDVDYMTNTFQYNSSGFPVFAVSDAVFQSVGGGRLSVLFSYN